MSNETTIRANVKVSGLSELEKANSLIKEMNHSLSSLGRTGGNNGLSGLSSSINKAKVEAKELKAAIKQADDVNLSKVGNAAAESLSKAENKANQLKAKLEQANNVNLAKAGSSASEGLNKAESKAGQLKNKLEQANDVNLSKVGNSASEGLSKAEAKASQLRSKLEQVNNINGGMAGQKISEGLSRAESKANQFQGSVRKSIAAERELASAAHSVAQAEQQSASAAQRGAQARQQAVQAARQNAQSERQMAMIGSSSPDKKEGKVRGAIRDVAGMYTLGNLAANGIMAAGEGVKGLFGSGLSYISQQQASQVSWASNARSVNKLLGKNMSNKEATSFSKGMVKDISNLATSAGNDYKQVSDAALAFYATGAGVSTAGNKKKTLQLTKDMLNLQDAGGMNDEEMGRFISSVAKTLDQDKLTTERLQQLKQFNPNIDEYLDKAHKKRTGEKAGKVGDYTGDDLVKALHMAGMAPGVNDASKKMNQSLAGVQRAIKNGAVRMTAGFEERLASGLNKAFGGDGKLFSRITDWFNSPKKTEGFTNKVADGTAGVISTVGKGGREAFDLAKKLSDVAKPIAGGFSTGFIDQVKAFKNGLSTAYNGLKSTASKLSDTIPKGAKGKFSSIGNELGNATGKITAFLVAVRGLSKLPKIGQGITKAMQPLLKFASKLPVVGKGLSGLISKITGIKKLDETKNLSAAGKMQNAANTMMSAANRMNSGSRNSGFGGNGVKSAGYYGSSNGYYNNGEIYDGYTGPLTRTGLYHSKAGTNGDPNAWFNKLISRGQNYLGAANPKHGKGSFVQRIKGNVLTGVGRAGQRVFGESRIGNVIYRGALASGRGLRATRGFIAKGAPGMNATFAAMDAMSVIGTTKSGSLARHKGVGNAVGQGVGSTVGMAAGTALGSLIGMPTVGAVAGSFLGGWAGGKVGSWIGSKFGGSKPSGNKLTQQQRDAIKADEIVAKTNFTNGYNSLYQNAGQKAPVSANKAYKTMNAASKGNAKSQAAAQLYDQAMQAGDLASANKYFSQAQKQVKAGDAKGVRSAQSRLSKAKKAEKKAYDDAYTKALGEAYNNGQRGKAAREQAKQLAKGDKNYQKARKNTKSAQNKVNKAKKKYKDDTGEDYKKSKASSKGKGSKSGASKKNSKSGSKNRGSSKGSSKPKSKGSSRKSSRSKAKSSRGNSKPASKKSRSSSGKKRSNGSKNASRDQKAASRKLDKAASNLNKSASKKAKSSSKRKGSSKSNNKSRSSSKPHSKTANVKAKTKGTKDAKKLSKATKGVKSKNAKVKANVKGTKDAKKLSKATKGVKNKSAKVKAKTSGGNKVKKLAKDTKKVKNKNAKIKAKTSGGNKVKKLAKDTKKIKNKNAKVKVKVSGESKVKKLAKDIKKVKNKNARVRARVSGEGKVKKLSQNIKKVKNKNARVRATASGAGKVKSLASSIKRVKNKTARVRASASGAGQVKSLASAINRVKNKTARVTAHATGTGQVKSLQSAINGVKNKTASVTAKVTGTGQVKQLTSAINSVKGKSVSVTAKVSGTGEVRGLASAIAAVHSKHVTISATVTKSGHLATGTPGASNAFRGRLATGTPGAGASFVAALATGTPAATTNQWSANGGVKKGNYLVNDAPGADFVEAFMTRAGTIGLFPKQRNLIVPLGEGTQVLNANETKKKFPRLKTGTPSFNIKNDAKSSNKSEKSTVVNNNTFNINVNVDGSAGIDQKLINKIANQIAEKLTVAFPESEV
ncbi:hypothetical protein H5S09_04225 [Limosilactobacillus sp. STM2_1]|uniref:Uncharacterized protein n=1 Tax=Limosilactobacillus rudii TaxID=2759755 RepID=A0A7W3ULB4_9LACO|nr:hypothetical protein [Limosilactobacillus rudii]MBB1078969.1 hypothetical protein [Limosilactobacillus rudii]MBB1097150.1 hypothetical protein [Limosilactobacillus rudii]MCD7134143.1 hypothetical protein [Limosilactobacillus rudii]